MPLALSEGTEKVRFPSIPLISVPSGRFPRARLQPIEQQRVRFAVFLRSLQKLRHSCPVLPTLALLLAKAVLRNGSSCGVFSSRCSRWSRRSSLQSTSFYYKKELFQWLPLVRRLHLVNIGFICPTYIAVFTLNAENWRRVE